MQRRILITGGFGFIGRHVLKTLLDSNLCEVNPSTNTIPAQVYVMSRDENKIGPNTIYFDFTKYDSLHQIELAADLMEIFQRYQFTDVIHLAWHTGPKMHGAMENYNWVDYTAILYQVFNRTKPIVSRDKCAAQFNSQHFIVAGTVSEYDFSVGYLSEDSRLANESNYGKAKVLAHKKLDSLQKQGVTLFPTHESCPITWLRLFNVFGVGQPDTKVTSHIVKSLVNGQELTLSSGQQALDFIPVGIVAKAIFNTICTPTDKLPKTINVCLGKATKIDDILNYVKDALSVKRIKRTEIPAAFQHSYVCGDPSRFYKTIGSFISDTNRSAETIIKDELDSIIDYYKNASAGSKKKELINEANV